MGRDNQPKHRRARDLKRRRAQREPYARVLIVCEGKKTEPLYFGEIRRECRLATTNLQVLPSPLGTDPLQVVAYAEQLLRRGDENKGIDAGAFDRAFTVFDRDDHANYHPALAQAAALNKKCKNAEGEPVPFAAIASVPCFEVWLLMHFEDVLAPLHRDEVYRRLRGHLPAYSKGQGGHFDATRHLLAAATARAEAASAKTTAHDGHEPYTGMHVLVTFLTRLKPPVAD